QRHRKRGETLPDVCDTNDTTNKRRNNMKLKQVTALGLAAALGLTALTACGGSGSSTASSETASAAASSEATSASAAADASTGIEPCEVTFWHAMTGQQETTLTELA